MRGRLELRNAREHRRVERLFRAAQEARNAIIEDSRPARAWNLRELRRRRREDPDWKPGSDDWFDWQGKDGPRVPGKLAQYMSQAVRNRTVKRLREQGRMELASEYTVALARGEASRVARGVAKGGRKVLRFRGWRERGSVEWDRLAPIRFAEGSRRFGKLLGKDTGALRFRLYEEVSEDAEIRSVRLVRKRQGERGVGPAVYEVHLTVRETVAEQPEMSQLMLVGVDAGGRATATDDCGATTVLGAVDDAAADKGLQRDLSRRRKGSKGRRKARARLGRHRSREKDRKRALCRKKASRMVRRDRCIVVEDLDHHAMRRKGKGRRKRGMNRSLKNGSPGMFRKALHEIAGRRGDCAVVEVPAAYTSRQCVRCGSRETVLERTDIECGSCGARIGSRPGCCGESCAGAFGGALFGWGVGEERGRPVPGTC